MQISIKKTGRMCRFRLRLWRNSEQSISQSASIFISFSLTESVVRSVGYWFSDGCCVRSRREGKRRTSATSTIRGDFFFLFSSLATLIVTQDTRLPPSPHRRENSPRYPSGACWTPRRKNVFSLGTKIGNICMRNRLFLFSYSNLDCKFYLIFTSLYRKLLLSSSVLCSYSCKFYFAIERTETSSFYKKYIMINM